LKIPAPNKAKSAVSTTAVHEMKSRRDASTNSNQITGLVRDQLYRAGTP
jgi:hypothetical protein